MKKCEVWIYRLAAVMWMVMLTWESNQPGTKIQINHPVDKIVHASAFGVLGFFLALGSGKRLQRQVLWLVPLLVMLFGCVDEFHQSFSPGRTVSAGDILADTVGGVAAACAWWLAHRQGKNESV